MDPGRYLELPPTVAAVDPAAGERVLDLASPKLAAVALARRGATVTSVDLFEAEVATWRELAGDQPGLAFEVGDGRSLGHGDASFDHAYSISVLEHMPDGGAEQALGELARVVRPGGRVVVTLPYADRYHEVWHEQPAYGEQEARPGRALLLRALVRRGPAWTPWWRPCPGCGWSGARSCACGRTGTAPTCGRSRG